MSQKQVIALVKKYAQVSFASYAQDKNMWGEYWFT